MVVATAASLGKGGASPYLQIPSRPAPGVGQGSGNRTGSATWFMTDPRSASTQSLAPSDVDYEPGLVHGDDFSPHQPAHRRTLLIVYIHGFYGTAQSFKSFPAHVHGYLKTLLSETHVIHSKIYPRYKCYRAIEVARDNFSAWLEPHTSPTTDVVLVGHSMGGLLSAEVVLMPNQNPYVQHPFKHRILGTISLDSPFLGLHPGIVVSGISSLFQPAASPPPVEYGGRPGAASNASLTTMESDGNSSSSVMNEPTFPPERQPTDPFFNPTYFNDTPFREQPFVKRLFNFANKHKAEGIFRAVRNHVTSHLEFAGCLTDYPGMSTRYYRLRALEDVDEILAVSQGHPRGAHARVRFVNYYTLSSGRPKPPKSPASSDGEAQSPSRLSLDSTRSLRDDAASVADNSGLPKASSSSELETHEVDSKDSTALSMANPAGSKDEHSTDKLPLESHSQPDGSPDIRLSESIQETEPRLSQVSTASAWQDTSTIATTIESSQNEDAGSLLNLPSLPEPPTEPVLPNPEEYADKEERKQAEKERKRLQKAHEKAVKEHAKAVRERDKLIQKAQKDAAKEQRPSKAEQGSASTPPVDATTTAVGTVPGASPAQSSHEAGEAVVAEAQALDAAKPKKKRKFCRLPSKYGGVIDPTWVDIYIDGVDEVGAHSGLFLPGPHYDKLVGDVGSRILGWVQDDLTKRAILDMDS